MDPEDPKKLVVPKQQSINKIGHALCQLDPVFREQTLANDKLQGLARDLGVHKDPLGTSVYLMHLAVLTQEYYSASIHDHLQTA